MVTVHLMVGVMSQVELALVMMDMMETSVKVNIFFTLQYVYLFNINWQIHIYRRLQLLHLQQLSW